MATAATAWRLLLATGGIIAALGTGFNAHSVQAGPLADAAARAERLADRGKTKEAFELMQEAYGDFSESLPFTVNRAVFVPEKPAAYGAYVAKPDSVFKPGEKLVTYLELIGLSWRDLQDGNKQANFTVDLQLTDSKGKTLAEQKGFGNFSFTGHVRNQEIYTHLTLDVAGARPGEYLLRYIVHDVYDEGTAEVELPFTIVEDE